MKLTLILLFAATVTQAQLVVSVSPLKITGQKAVVPLAMKNNFTERIESARAVVFLMDEQGKMIGQSTKWVFGESGLAAGATNTFYFVITADKPFATTNLNAQVQFSRVVLEDGKLADVSKAVQIHSP